MIKLCLHLRMEWKLKSSDINIIHPPWTKVFSPRWVFFFVAPKYICISIIIVFLLMQMWLLICEQVKISRNIKYNSKKWYNLCCNLVKLLLYCE